MRGRVDTASKQVDRAVLVQLWEATMEKPQRSDPTFSIFVVLAFVFLVAIMYVTFPTPSH